MLVVSRTPGERILIGDNIVITVLGTFGRKTRIGIEAPHDISVDREEIRLKKGAAKVAAEPAP